MDHRCRQSTVIRWSLRALALAWLIGNSSIWQMQPPTVSLDASWKAVIHHAWTQSWQHGKDIAFTYGPYGWLVTDHVYPPTFWLDALYRAASLGLALTVIVRLVGMSRFAAPLLAVLLIETTRLYVDAYLYLLASLPLWVIWRVREKWTATDLALLRVTMANLGLLVLVKHGFAAVAAFIVAVVAAHAWRGDRRVAWSLLTLLGAGAVAWLLAGQSIGNIDDYVIAAWAMVSGYTEAMALYGQPWSDACAAAAAAGFLMAAITAQCNIQPKMRIANVLGIAGVTFVVLKGSIVRTDPGHTFIAAGVFPVWAAMGVLLLPRPPKRGVLVVCIAGLALAAGASVMSSPRSASLPPLHERWLARWTGAGLRFANAGRTLTNPGRVDALHARANQRFRATLPLAPLTGAVDLNGAAQAALLAGNLNYQPRPVFQSYSVYHPRLQRLNLQHLTSDAAPDWMIITTQSSDNRYPATEDGLLYPHLLTRYRWQRPLPGGWHLLQRDTAPRTFNLRPIGEQQAAIGQFIAAPTSPHVVWAQIDVAYNAMGKAMSALYKPPPIYILVETAGGLRTSRRLIRSMARAGFILSPMQRHPASYAALATGEPADVNAANRVTRFAVAVGDTCGGARCVRSNINIRLFELTWNRHGIAPGSRPDQR